MAFSVGNGNGGGGRGPRRWARGSSSISEINVVPLVDVVLVLLIIFMLTAHVMEYGLEIDVPAVRQVKQEASEDNPLVSLTKEGLVYLGDKPVNINALSEELHTRYAGKTAVYVRCDREAIFEQFAQITSELGAGGFEVKVITRPMDSEKNRH